MIKPFHKHQVLFERCSASASCFLVLHALILKKINICNDYHSLIATCIEWLTNVKVTEETEPKLPLIWSDIINLSLKYVEIDEARCGTLLYQFTQLLIQLSEDKEGSKWGRSLLGAIGIVKTNSMSLKYVFIIFNYRLKNLNH